MVMTMTMTFFIHEERETYVNDQCTFGPNLTDDEVVLTTKRFWKAMSYKPIQLFSTLISTKQESIPPSAWTRGFCQDI